MLYIHSNPVTGNDWEKNMGVNKTFVETRNLRRIINNIFLVAYNIRQHIYNILQHIYIIR